MSITFYNMTGCHFCKKAKEMFAAEIASGEIIEKPSSEAPPGTRGFPTFTANGKTHSGLPQSKQELYSKLNVSNLGVSKEKYMRGYGDPPPLGTDPCTQGPSFWCSSDDNFSKCVQSKGFNGNMYSQGSPCVTNVTPNFYDWSTLFIKPISPAIRLLKYIYIPLYNIVDTGLTGAKMGFLIGIGSNIKDMYYSEVYNISQQPGKQTQSIKDSGISNEITVVTKQDIPFSLFPCVSSSDWNSIFIDGKIPNGFLAKLIPPQPCRTDNSVYCCAGKDGPNPVFCKPCKKQHFFDIKTITMFCFILLLLSLLLYMIMNNSSSSSSSSGFGSNSINK